MIQLGGINGDGVFYLLEQVFVVHDVTKVLVIPIQPVDAADGLEQPMILHALVNIEVSAARRIEAS